MAHLGGISGKFKKLNKDRCMRSLLFVPADGGPKLDKALASGADAVIVDLEDSIVPERKPAAREAALAFLKKARETLEEMRAQLLRNVQQDLNADSVGCLVTRCYEIYVF